MKEMFREKHSRWFKAGVVLIIFWSIVIGVFNFGVLYLFGIPIFGLLIGLFLVWISEAAVKEKFLLTLLPVPVVLIIFFSMFQLTKAEPEIFLIPQDYRGEIVVFYGENCGQPPIYENGSRIYNVSGSGVSITAFKENDGHFNRKFYLVDENGNRTEIPQFQWQNVNSEQRDRNYFHSASTEITKDSTGAFWSYGSETYQISKNSIAYIISTFRHFEKDSKEKWVERKNFTETAEKALSECRQNPRK